MNTILPGEITVQALLTAIVVCCLTWVLVLLMHGYLKYGNEFRIGKWFKEHVGMLVVGFVVTLIIAGIRGFTKDMQALASMFGIQPKQPGAAITLGLAIAGFLLGLGPKLRNKNGKENQTNQTKG